MAGNIISPAVPTAATWKPPPLVWATLALHVAALGYLAAWPDRWLTVALVVVANHALITAAVVLPRCSLLGTTVTRARVEGRSTVILTFDDGPDPVVTPQILEILGRRKAVGTFFFIGEKAAQHPDLVRLTVQQGHRVENHTYSHSNAFSFWGPKAIGADIDRAQALLGDLAGSAPTAVRPPAGIRNIWFHRAVARRGLSTVAWTRRGFDTLDGNAERVCKRLTRGLGAGDILVLHDGSAASDPNGDPVILSLLPKLLDALAERDLDTGPLSV